MLCSVKSNMNLEHFEHSLSASQLDGASISGAKVFIIIIIITVIITITIIITVIFIIIIIITVSITITITIIITRPRPAFGLLGLGRSSGGKTSGGVSTSRFAPSALSSALKQYILALLS